MRLIDADELLKRMQDYYGIVADMEKIMVETIFVDGEGGEFVIQTAKTTLEEIEDFFKNTPTIDPVKHGKWIDKAVSIKGVPTEACSECGEWSYGDEKPFCPNCGASMDMDGGEDDGPV